LLVLPVDFRRRLSDPLGSVLLTKRGIFSLFSLNYLLNFLDHLHVFVSENIGSLDMAIELSFSTLHLVLSNFLPDFFREVSPSRKRMKTTR
jgi:hypothetical protein